MTIALTTLPKPAVIDARNKSGHEGKSRAGSEHNAGFSHHASGVAGDAAARRLGGVEGADAIGLHLRRVIAPQATQEGNRAIVVPVASEVDQREGLLIDRQKGG
jgi:hypothetical protein